MDGHEPGNRSGKTSLQQHWSGPILSDPQRQSGPSGRPSPPHVRSNINEKTSVFWEAKIMKKFAFVAAPTNYSVCLLSLAPAQTQTCQIRPTLRFTHYT